MGIEGLCRSCGVIMTYVEEGLDPHYHPTCGPNLTAGPNPRFAEPDGPNPHDEGIARDLDEVIMWEHNQSPRSQQVMVGPSELGDACLTGDTEVVTRDGIRLIADLVGKTPTLLVPMLYEGSQVRKRWGRFMEAPVQYFGDQETYVVTLRRGQERKVIRATADHRWFRTFYSGKQKAQGVCRTNELQPGHRLTQLRRAMPTSTTLMHWAVAQGFTFGDGTRGSRDAKHRPATLNLYHNGKDQMLRFFPGDWATIQQPDHTHPHSVIRNLPRFWKELPPIQESTSFLMSWLAGYFAADGCVTEDGHCRISSAKREHLEFVRSLAAVCGVGYGQIRENYHLGINQNKETPLYTLSLRRRDLPPWFFLINRHAERVNVTNQAQERDPLWTVVTVESTGKIEPVYCATVEGIGAFGLADDLMTGNCDRKLAYRVAGVAPVNTRLDPWPAWVGTAVHQRLESAINKFQAEAGAVRWMCEMVVYPDDLVLGHCDLYDRETESLWDFKTANADNLRKFRTSGPPDGYRTQVHLYGRGMSRAGFPVKRVGLVAFPRAGWLSGKWVWSEPYNEDIATSALSRMYRIADQVIDLELDKHPERAENVEATPSQLCSFCEFYTPEPAGGYGCPGK